MNPTKAMTKITHRVQSYTTKISGETVPEVTQADVSMALAGLDKRSGPYLVMRVKFAHDKSCVKPLRSAAFYESLKIAYDEKWIVKGHKKDTIWNLVDLAIYELVTPPHCPVCNGTGVLEQFECIACDGSGSQKLTIQQRAHIAEMTVTEFKTWRSHAETIFQLLHGWEISGLEHVSRRLA